MRHPLQFLRVSTYVKQLKYLWSFFSITFLQSRPLLSIHPVFCDFVQYYYDLKYFLTTFIFFPFIWEVLQWVLTTDMSLGLLSFIIANGGYPFILWQVNLKIISAMLTWLPKTLVDYATEYLVIMCFNVWITRSACPLALLFPGVILKCRIPNCLQSREKLPLNLEPLSVRTH